MRKKIKIKGWFKNSAYIAVDGNFIEARFSTFTKDTAQEEGFVPAELIIDVRKDS